MNEYENPDHWNVAARHYQQTAEPFTAHFARAALARLALGPHSHVLDVAAGTGALALAAARTGAQVLATDFSPAMLACVAAQGLPNVKTRVMDGQALDLPDASFDAVFSIFGVIMFPDWRKGLAEMQRVTRPGGFGVVASWQKQGAATFLLLGSIRRNLFPERVGMTMPEAVLALSEPDDFAAALIEAGYSNPVIESVTHDFQVDVTALDEPDKLFGMSPDWTSLSAADKAAVIGEVRRLAADRPVLSVPSTALIAVATRRA
ncbi:MULTISPECIES: class I SAM-dependent methyltransferase [Pseudomonas]|uniref:Ubiquinone biosynthesis protein UbiE n=1 Tax=Pseudomonas fulva TaxID=47880 RepID=A0A0D0L5C6_9PSED|nr:MULTISPECIES: class I SAM-dependent methyltransferase [Pseudomonas]KIQ06172.1 ubiquinone biosynthesis protein UbiE [Pseudomonas fulva]